MSRPDTLKNLLAVIGSHEQYDLPASPILLYSQMCIHDLFQLESLASLHLQLPLLGPFQRFL